MKSYLLTAVTAILLLFTGITTVSAQTPDTIQKATDTTAATLHTTTRPTGAIPEPDDEFNVFLLIFAICIVSFTLGAVVTGVILVSIALLAIVAMSTAGIISAAIIMSIYKRSFAAGFKTLLLTGCSIGGIIAGGSSFWLIARLFHLQVNSVTAIIAGILSGLAGGILLALSLYKVVRMLSTYGKNKLADLKVQK